MASTRLMKAHNVRKEGRISRRIEREIRAALRAEPPLDTPIGGEGRLCHDLCSTPAPSPTSLSFQNCENRVCKRRTVGCWLCG